MSYVPAQLFEYAIDFRANGNLATCVWHYASAQNITPNPVEAQDLQNELSGTFSTTIRQALSADTQILRGRCVELRPGATIASQEYANAFGNVNEDSLPQFNAYGFVSPRLDRTIRAGHKRIPGVVEAWQRGGLINSAAATTALNAVAAQMNLPRIPSGDPTVYQLYPVVVSFDFEGAPRAAPLVRLATNWTFQRITSQLSRKA